MLSWSPQTGFLNTSLSDWVLGRQITGCLMSFRRVTTIKLFHDHKCQGDMSGIGIGTTVIEGFEEYGDYGCKLGTKDFQTGRVIPSGPGTSLIFCFLRGERHPVHRSWMLVSGPGVWQAVWCLSWSGQWVLMSAYQTCSRLYSDCLPVDGWQ